MGQHLLNLQQMTILARSWEIESNRPVSDTTTRKETNNPVADKIKCHYEITSIEVIPVPLLHQIKYPCFRYDLTRHSQIKFRQLLTDKIRDSLTG